MATLGTPVRPAAARAAAMTVAPLFVLWVLLALGLGPDFIQIPSALAYASILFGVPLAGALALFFFPDAARPYKLAVGGMWIVAGAVASTFYALGSTVLIVGLAGLVLTTVLVRRFPAQTVFVIFAITGTYGSIQAFTPLETGPTVDLLLGALWLGVLVPQAFSRRRDYNLLLWPGVAVVLAFGLFTLASVPFAPDTYEGLRAFRQATWYILALVAVGYLGLKPPSRDRLVLGVVAVCALVGAYATLRWAIGPSGKEKAFAATTGEVKYDIAAGDTKLQGSLENGSVLGLWTAVTIPFCVALALSMRGKGHLLAIAAVPLLTFGLLGSQVRTGAVAAVLGVAVVLALYALARGFRGPRLGTIGAALAAVVITAVVIFPTTAGDSPEKVERYSNIFTPSQDLAFQERRFKWDSALRESVRSPFGRGLGTAGFRSVNQRFQATETGGDVDNSYVMVAFEQGFAAMVFLILALLVLLAGLVRRAVWTLSPQRAMIAVGAAGTLTALMVMFGTRLYIQSLASLGAWIIVGLGVAEFTRVDRTRRRPEPIG